MNPATAFIIAYSAMGIILLLPAIRIAAKLHRQEWGWDMGLPDMFLVTMVMVSFWPIVLSIALLIWIAKKIFTDAVLGFLRGDHLQEDSPIDYDPEYVDAMTEVEQWLEDNR